MKLPSKKTVYAALVIAFKVLTAMVAFVQSLTGKEEQQDG